LEIWFGFRFFCAYGFSFLGTFSGIFDVFLILTHLPLANQGLGFVSWGDFQGFLRFS
jgi:hypothetical protein